MVVGETCATGIHVKIYQGVPSASLSTRSSQLLRGVQRHPTIEDNVTVSAGASIAGGKTVIGEGVATGSNVFIATSLPDRTRVSVKSPELQPEGRKPTEFEQDGFPDRVI